MMDTQQEELLNSLEEMVTACKCAFRAIATDSSCVDRFDAELRNAGVKEGFGVRAQDLIKRIKKS